jgi:hypothetical protein
VTCRANLEGEITKSAVISKDKTDG